MPPEPFNLRSIAVGAYGPSLFYGVATGAILPAVSLTARDLGADLATAAFIIALTGIGSLLANIPATLIATRFGERRALIAASLWCSGAMLFALVAPTLASFAAAVVLVGMAGAVFGLARQSYLTEAVPARYRARALSTLGGVNRIGIFIGPFAAALMMSFFGLDGAYWVGAGAAFAAAILSWRVPELPSLHHKRNGAQGTGGAVDVPTIRSTLRDHRRIFVTVGSGVLLLAAVRATRQAVLPLWAETIGLDAATTALVFGVSGAVDMLVFYPAGKVMDVKGRSWVAVPCLAIMGIALAVMPFTESLTGLVVVAVALGFGNGIGSGIVMTLGADFSPTPGRPQFLGVWRLLADSGTMAGPAALSVVTGFGTLALGIWFTGGLAFLGAAALWYWIPRSAPPDAERVRSLG